MLKVDIITADMVLGWHPCEAYPEFRLREIYGKAGLTPLDVVGLDVPKDDILWTLLREDVFDAHTLHSMACDFAEKIALPIWDRHYPEDPRPRQAIVAKRLWIKGETTDKEVDAAESAARSAAESVAESVARFAAESAARSTARSAAWSTAWSTAWSAARSAAESAAWSAAESTARSAARSAAEYAARSAAWSVAWFAAESAARSAVLEIIRGYIQAEGD